MNVLRISVLLLCATSSCAPQEPSIPSSTQVQVTVPAAAARLEAPSNQLSEAQRAMLLAQLERTASTTNSNVGILIVPALNGETIDSLAPKTFTDWHLGEKGVLLLLVMDEHRARIETGHAIEGVLTDDLCGHILRHLRPRLQQGEVYEALHEGLEAIDGILQRQRDAGTKPQRVGRTFSKRELRPRLEPQADRALRGQRG